MYKRQALPKSVPTRVRNLHEEDEDFWLDNRSLILTSYDFEKSSALPTSSNKKNSCCFVDAQIFKPDKIRNYLSVYERVVISYPLIGQDNDFLEDVYKRQRRNRCQASRTALSAAG